MALGLIADIDGLGGRMRYTPPRQFGMACRRSSRRIGHSTSFLAFAGSNRPPQSDRLRL